MDTLNFWNNYYAQDRKPGIATDEVLMDEIGKLAPGRALDLGAGSGVNSLWLAEQGWAVTAVDFASTAIARLSKLIENKESAVEVIEADILEYRPADLFDLVLLCHIHLAKKQRPGLLATAASAVAPGGTLLYIGIARSTDPTDKYNQEVFAPTEEIARIVAEQPGLIVNIAETRHRIIHFSKNIFAGNGVIVRAHRPSTPWRN
jgi:2-polyprenyl-3-methyl-5-hydroxy-6-metoxy-1,4-benzoquinol methylase